jgi:subtilisin-like proprotein convertase family protein
LAAFNGSNPNGTWSVYVVDDANNSDAGAIGGGWCLDIDSIDGTVATQTAVVSSPNPSPQGVDATFTATVTDGGDPVTEGTVTFLDGGTLLAGDVALDEQGQATFTTDSLTAGSHAIAVTYNGTPGFAASRATLTHFVEATTTPAEGMWCNTAPISVPANGTEGVAGPYPSTILVGGADPTIGELSVQLAGITHTFPADLDVLLVGPGGDSMILISEVGHTAGAFGVRLTFADGAPAASDPLRSGSYQPTNLGAGDSWPAPAPPPPHGATLAGFDGTDPNGTWSLYVVDDAVSDVGAIAGGWCLTISSDAMAATATALVSAPNPSLQGAEVTFTATVTDDAGDPVPDGTVTFDTGAIELGTDDVDAQGQATLTIATLTAGSHVISATYSGASGYLTSVITAVHFVADPVSPCPGSGPITVPGTFPSNVASPTRRRSPSPARTESSPVSWSSSPGSATPSPATSTCSSPGPTVTTWSCPATSAGETTQSTSTSPSPTVRVPPAHR